VTRCRLPASGCPWGGRCRLRRGWRQVAWPPRTGLPPDPRRAGWPGAKAAAPAAWEILRKAGIDPAPRRRAYLVTLTQARQWQALPTACTTSRTPQLSGTSPTRTLDRMAERIIPVGRLSFPTGRIVSTLDRQPPLPAWRPCTTSDGDKGANAMPVHNAAFGAADPVNCYREGYSKPHVSGKKNRARAAS
jgi:hypothetical protein